MRPCDPRIESEKQKTETETPSIVRCCAVPAQIRGFFVLDLFFGLVLVYAVHRALPGRRRPKLVFLAHRPLLFRGPCPVVYTQSPPSRRRTCTVSCLCWRGSGYYSPTLPRLIIRTEMVRVV